MTTNAVAANIIKGNRKTYQRIVMDCPSRTVQIECPSIIRLESLPVVSGRFNHKKSSMLRMGFKKIIPSSVVIPACRESFFDTERFRTSRNDRT